MTTQVTSYAASLRNRLNEILVDGLRVIERSTIKTWSNDGPTLVVGPPHYWSQPSEEVQRLQIPLLRKLNTWLDHMHFLIAEAPEQVKREMHETETFVREWLEQHSSWTASSNWEVPRTNAEAAKVLECKFALFFRLLHLLGGAATGYAFVPDTNALIKNPDVSTYGSEVGAAAFNVVIMPTVLDELDKLKVTNRDQQFRDKVDGVIRRIKGWRGQGSLLTGVTVNKVATVRMVAAEPDFQATLAWLDAANADDRLVASSLQLQRDEPGSIVTLVTSDINLQNKAEMASLPYIETP